MLIGDSKKSQKLTNNSVITIRSLKKIKMTVKNANYENTDKIQKADKYLR